MTKISKFKILFLLSVLCFLFSVNLAEAAELKLSLPVLEIEVRQQFQVDLFLNTENEDINAIEGKIVFPANILELKEIKDGNSIINFWVEKPRSDSSGEVIFAGITPGGFKSENGFVFSLVFAAKEKNKGRIEFSGIKALKNDGLGTPVDVFAQPLEFKIAEAGLAQEESVEIKARDYEPPESFAPEIARDESIFGGKWFLVFATQDKSSGISRYEVSETKEFRMQNLEFREDFFIFYILNPKSLFKSWVIAESPYVLKDQGLRSYIYVKAVDKAGNERIETIYPRNPLKWYENYLIYVIIIVIIFIGCILWKIFNKSKIK